MSEPITFSDADKATGLWAKFVLYQRQQLDELRVKNDDPTLSEMETATLRGEIKRIKAFLDHDRDVVIEEQPIL